MIASTFTLGGKEQFPNRCLGRTSLIDPDVERLLKRFCSEESVYQQNLILEVLGPLPTSKFSSVSKEVLERVFAKLVGIGRGGVLIQYSALKLVKKVRNFIAFGENDFSILMSSRPDSLLKKVRETGTSD